MTRKLWRGLRNPPVSHPLFRHIVLKPAALPVVSRGRRYLAALLFGLLVSSVLFPSTLMMLLFALGSLPFLFILLNGTGYGLISAGKIAETTAQEKEQGTYDLLAVSPAGALGMHWLIAVGCINRKRRFQQLHAMVLAALVILLVALVVSMPVMIFSAAGLAVQERGQIVLTLISAMAFLIGVYLDHVQSVILGALIGMLIPVYVGNRLDARLWAAGVFLLLQFSFYLTLWLLGMGLLPMIFDSLRRDGISIDIGLVLLRLWMFYSLREGLITLVWRTLAARLDSDSLELEFTLHPAA